MKLILVLLFAYSSYGWSAQDPVVAEVGNKKITLSEFDRKYKEVKGAINPPSKEQFLEDLVRYEIGLQEAYKEHFDKDPIAQERMQQELYKALLEKALSPRVEKIAVNEKDMKAYYKNHPEVRASHILIEVSTSANAQQRESAKKRALEIYAEVKKSKRPFEELVKLYSDDVLSKQAGGDVGWQSSATILPAYYNTLMHMKVGEITGLVETPFGLHIVKLTGINSYENADKRRIRMAVFDEKRKELFNEYFTAVKKGYVIKVNAKLIKQDHEFVFVWYKKPRRGAFCVFISKLLHLGFKQGFATAHCTS